MNPNLLQTPITYLKGVGPNRAQVLQSELGIQTYEDLLSHYPNRYIDKTKYYKINELERNSAEVQLIGKIIHLKTVEQKEESDLWPLLPMRRAKWNWFGFVVKNGSKNNLRSTCLM